MKRVVFDFILFSRVVVGVSEGEGQALHLRWRGAASRLRTPCSSPPTGAAAPCVRGFLSWSLQPPSFFLVVILWERFLSVEFMELTPVRCEEIVGEVFLWLKCAYVFHGFLSGCGREISPG